VQVPDELEADVELELALEELDAAEDDELDAADDELAATDEDDELEGPDEDDELEGPDEELEGPDEDDEPEGPDEELEGPPLVELVVLLLDEAVGEHELDAELAVVVPPPRPELAPPRPAPPRPEPPWPLLMLVEVPRAPPVTVELCSEPPLLQWVSASPMVTKESDCKTATRMELSLLTQVTLRSPCTSPEWRLDEQPMSAETHVESDGTCRASRRRRFFPAFGASDEGPCRRAEGARPQSPALRAGRRTRS
jgi:hypothetical protein